MEEGHVSVIFFKQTILTASILCVCLTLGKKGAGQAQGLTILLCSNPE